MTLNGHTGHVSSVFKLYDGRLASGSFDKSIKILSITTDNCDKTIYSNEWYSIFSYSTIWWSNSVWIKCSLNWNIWPWLNLSTLLTLFNRTISMHDLLMQSQLIFLVIAWNCSCCVCSYSISFFLCGLLGLVSRQRSSFLHFQFIKFHCLYSREYFIVIWQLKWASRRNIMNMM
jgi:hypothetical protein